MKTAQIISTNPELNGQEVIVIDWKPIEGKVLVSFKDTPRLAFYWDRNWLQIFDWAESHKEHGGAAGLFSDCPFCNNTPS